MAACLSPFIDRNRIGGRLPLTRVFHNACAWNRDVRRTCVQPRLYVRMCTRALQSRAQTRSTDSTSWIGAPYRAEEAEDRIDSPVIQRDPRRTERGMYDESLTSCLERVSSVSLRETRDCARNKAFTTVPIMCQRDAKTFFNIFQITIAILWFCILHYVCWIEISIDIKFFSTSLYNIYQKYQDAADSIVGRCTRARGIIVFAAVKLYQAKVRFVPRDARESIVGLTRICEREIYIYILRERERRADRLLGGVISLVDVDAERRGGRRRGWSRGLREGIRGCAVEGFVPELGSEPRGHHFQRNRERARTGTRGSPDPAAIPIASLFDMRQFRPICRAP